MSNKIEAAQVTREMIDLYDEYTHLTLDRRKFLDKLALLTGSAGAAAAVLPLIEANPATASIVTADDPRITASAIEYGSLAGPIKGYLVTPAKPAGKLGTVIVIHENRGLNEHIRDVARRVALEGFVALAPDLLSSLGGTPENEEKAREMISALKPEAARDSALGAVDFLAEHAAGNGRVGAVGFCWGGGMVNTLAVNSPNLSAGAVFYGRSPGPADVPKIKARMLLHYAGLDDRINATVPDYEKALKAAGVDYTLHMYDKVNHAFHNDTSSARYDEAAAQLAFSRTIDFFKKSLS